MPRIVLARIQITNLVMQCLHFSTSLLEYFELKCSLVHLLVYLTPFTVSSFQENSLHNMFDFVHSFRVTSYFSGDEFVKEMIIL